VVILWCVKGDSLFVCVGIFVISRVLPPFFLLNIMMRRSLACSRKKSMIKFSEQSMSELNL
jgi:hypothetical protein